MKIAVDAMGGDNAPRVIIEGVEEARDLYPDLEFDLYGNPDKVKPLIKNNERLNIVATSEEISMGEEPVRAIRRKKIRQLFARQQQLKKEKLMPSFLRETLGQFWRLAFSLLAVLKELTVRDSLVFCQLPSRVLVDTILSTSILVQMRKVKRKIWNNMPTLVNSMPKMYWELRTLELRY